MFDSLTSTWCLCDGNWFSPWSHGLPHLTAWTVDFARMGSASTASTAMEITELNTCCCIAPRGHYARGYEKIPCPGGTYQDQTGQNSCKPCSLDATVLFDVNYRGAIDLVDCDEAKSRCSSSSCSNSTECQVQCVSSVAVESAMVAKPADTAFCAGLDQQIPTRGCSWRTESSWAPSATAEAFLAVLILLIAREIWTFWAWRNSTAQF